MSIPTGVVEPGTGENLGTAALYKGRVLPISSSALVTCGGSYCTAQPVVLGHSSYKYALVSFFFILACKY